MAAGLLLKLADLVKATLPQGFGRVGFIGVSPAGNSYHVLAPVEMDWASAVSVLGARGWMDQAGARPGWRYHICRPYSPPPPDCNRPAACDDFRSARLEQALRNGRQLAAWGGRQGWWVEMETPPETIAS